MRDLFSNLALQQTLSPAVYTADQNGAAVDRKGFDAILHVVNVGITADTLSGSVKIDFKLQESDDGATWNAVTRAYDVKQSTTAPYVAVDANGTFLTVDDNAEDDAVYKVGYIGNKRYSRVVADYTGTHTNGIELSMTAVKGYPASQPV
ncbi:hypothetical protein [Azohydromonas aeria]|uniref:hypothetical protein n=1 Tax=Azohydromonas aeria TaxID=2590212 RepID=UPI0012F91EC8|nr:hypothetical protein [Azohydromonas aeria]